MRYSLFPLLSGCLLVASPAGAAALAGPISGWASGVPSYVSMYEYVPDKLATNPPILVVAHYCSGNASGVFGEAKTGGIVAAADQYGFILVLPQTSNNCWDVGSSASLTHDGGGDTQAVAEMVKYELTKRSANANRVYITGTSSGAMMTEAMLAVYPEMFKAGAEFSGVPAGCWAVGYSSSNQWSGSCADGQVSHTAQEWGDLARKMEPNYSGPRPRVQLWHGLSDPTISPNNQTEAIKEWTNVLGLAATPTATTNVSLSNHQWTRQTWQDSCGLTVLDAWSETNGPHGTDANLNAMYVIPFLGLDKAGDTDPQQCGSAGMGGAGGTGGAGAAGAAAGGASAGGRGGGRGGSAGMANALGGRGGTSSIGSGGVAAAGSAGGPSGGGSAGENVAGRVGASGTGGLAGQSTGGGG
ncbi:MAG TPA: PHB depolymerase family esterase, partial [Polyangiaceae bacterium]|nr:PHB depolymerase family esterase [Polyangiaceae bacterium]